MTELAIEKFNECLKDLNIDEDIVIVHSRLVPFNVRKQNIEQICEMLIRRIGKNKSIIMPAFSYSFPRKKIWNYYNTKSQAGVLTEYFRKNISEERTIHPIHSISILNNKYSIQHFSSSSFGKGSAWEFLCQNEVCNLSIGIGLDGGGTICHFSEELFKVNYRKYIDLKGDVYDEKNKLVKKNFLYYARDEKTKVQNNWSKCENDLIKNKIMNRKFYLNNIPVCIMNTKKATKYIFEKLSEDNYYLTNKN